MDGAVAAGGIDVLLVEDNRGDVRLVERAFENRELPGTLHTVRTGGEALDWVFRRGDFADAPRPDLVLLDLNLPATSGQDVLAELKSDPRSRRLPVLVLTSSRSEDDLTRAYEAFANACLRKPVDPDEYGALVQTVVEFWGVTASLPPAFDDAGDQRR